MSAFHEADGAWFAANPRRKYRIRRDREARNYSAGDVIRYAAVQRAAVGHLIALFGYTGALPEDCRDELARRVFIAAWSGNLSTMPAALTQIKHEEAARLRIAGRRGASSGESRG